MSPGASATVPQRAAAAVIKEMRAALGGDAALDDIKTVALTAEGRLTVKGVAVGIRDESFLVLPDRYLRVRQVSVEVGETRVPGAPPRMYEGFRGDQLIRAVTRRPPPPVASDGDRLALAKWRHDASRLLLVLTGRPLPGYPLEFDEARVVDIGGTTYDVLTAQGPQGLQLTLYVDATTHLPALVETSGLEKTAGSKWFVSDFRKTGPLMWPRQFEQEADAVFTETLTVKTWKVNARIDARTFEPK